LLEPIVFPAFLVLLDALIAGMRREKADNKAILLNHHTTPELDGIEKIRSGKALKMRIAVTEVRRRVIT
jgi:hypothetical protein